MRVKYIRYGVDWCYALQVKKLIFWKTIATFSTLENLEEFVKRLKRVDDFNRIFGFDSKPLNENRLLNKLEE